jgi:hypothetical protein
MKAKPGQARLPYNINSFQFTGSPRLERNQTLYKRKKEKKSHERNCLKCPEGCYRILVPMSKMITH